MQALRILSASWIFFATSGLAVAPGTIPAARSCKTILRRPTPPGYHCGDHGTLESPSVISSTLIVKIAKPLDACRDLCLAEKGTCISFGYDSRTGKCQLFNQTLNDQGIKHGDTPTVFFNRHCFELKCTCTTTEVYTKEKFITHLISITDRAQTLATGTLTKTKFTDTLDTTVFTNTEILTVVSTALATQQLTSGTTTVPLPSTVRKARREIAKPSKGGCKTVTSTFELSRVVFHTIHETKTIDVEAAVTVGVDDVVTVPADSLSTTTTLTTSTTTSVVPAATVTAGSCAELPDPYMSTGGRQYSLHCGTVQGVASSGNTTSQVTTVPNVPSFYNCLNLCDGAAGCFAIDYNVNYCYLITAGQLVPQTNPDFDSAVVT